MAESKLTKFNFKTRQIKDENGNPIGVAKKQPSVEVALPVPSAEDIITYLSSDSYQKEAALILDAVASLIISQARSQFDDAIESFGDDLDKEVSAAVLNFDRLNLEYIASIPPAQRGASAISDEEWATFFEDYMPVMIAATGKDEKRIKNQVDLFKKPQKIKANKPILTALVDQLDIYLVSSKALDDTGPCAIRLRDKFARWAAEPEKAITLDSL